MITEYFQLLVVLTRQRTDLLITSRLDAADQKLTIDGFDGKFIHNTYYWDVYIGHKNFTAQTAQFVCSYYIWDECHHPNVI